MLPSRLPRCRSPLRLSSDPGPDTRCPLLNWTRRPAILLEPRPPLFPPILRVLAWLLAVLVLQRAMP